jgi:hypothetical protein
MLAALLVVFLGALAACGGDDDDSSAGETTTVATAATGGAERLSEAQWAEYQTSATAFRDANQAAVAKVNGCEAVTDVTGYKACVGDSLSKVVAATADLRDTLDGFEGEVAGACQSAYATFSGYLKNYQATANSLDKALSTGDATAFNAGKQNIKTVAAAGSPARDAFESACGPA